MDARQEHLAAALTDRYRVERELGRGGMAVVYLAHDLRHDRQVAIKVLKPDVAAALGPERFLREIRTTANLRHPHIVPLYDSGEADGILFYVMPLIQGESLRDRLDRERQLPLEEALRIAREVAGALGHAHAAGVVHRDVKPENILLERGQALVTDFGIARAAEPGRPRITQSGLVIGTPAYMSPEQAMGEADLDARSDVYSLGTVLYEMLVGEPPYTGPTPQAITAKRLMQPVPKVTILRAAVPAAVEQALLTALAQAPADRFATAAEFARALDDGSSGSAAAAPPRVPRRRAALALIGAIVLALVAGGFWLRRATREPAAAERPLIAVLPFRNAGLPEDEFFADGITEEITSRLGGVSGIGVISRTTALRYKGTTEPLRAIGRDLGVQYILAGTIRADRRPGGAGEVRVTPELVRISDETQVWTEGYTANLTPGEIFGIQMQIAEQVAAAAGVRLLAGDRARLAQRRTANPEAYDAYLRGRFLMNKRQPDAARDGIRQLEAAVALDPGFAAAWAALANAYADVPYYPFDILPGVDPLAKAEAAARQALTVDSTLADAHVALGSVLGNGRWRWDEAEAALRRAIALDPGYAPAHASYSDLLLLHRRFDSALAEADRAVALEPTSAPIRSNRASALAALGRYDEAVAEERRSLDLEPEAIFPHVNLAQIAAARGDIAEMARELFQTPVGALVGPALAAWAGDPSRRPDLLRAIERVTSPNPGLDATRRGWLFAVAGAPERAIAEFTKAVSARTPSALGALRFPVVERALGHLPAYQALLRQAGLPVSAE